MNLHNVINSNKSRIINDLNEVKGKLVNLERFIHNKKLDEIEILEIICSIADILSDIEKSGHILGSVNLFDFWIINNNLKEIIYLKNRRLLVEHDNLHKYVAGEICTPEVAYCDEGSINKSTDVNILGKILVKLIFNNRIKYTKESEERFLSYNLNLFDMNLPLELHTFIGKSTCIYNEERYESVEEARRNLHIIIDNFYKKRTKIINETNKISFEISGKTHVGDGKLKKYKLNVKDKTKLNEDSALILKSDDNKLFFMIADGVSNSSFGSGYIASNIIKKVCNYYWKVYESQLTDKITITNFFYNIVKDCSNEIFKYVKEELNNISYEEFLQSKGIMSSTLSAGIIINNKLYYISLGDSPIYVFSKDYNLTLLNNEDNLGKTALRYYMSIDSYNETSSKSSLTKYIGGVSYENGRFEPKVNNFKLKQFNLLDEDMVVVCSDGLTDYMYSAMRDGDPWAADMTLRDIFIKEKDKNIDKINQILVESANENGGGDNITSILIKIHLR